MGLLINVTQDIMNPGEKRNDPLYCSGSAAGSGELRS